MKSLRFFWVFVFFKITLINGQTTYIEEFNSIGKPTTIPNNSYWKFFNDIHPNQDTWEEFIPGDGYAYITVDANIHNDTDLTFPYQTLVFGGVGENHKLEVRMKGAVVDGGLVAFLFTYHEEGTEFNEVDIEVVANDKSTASHDVFPPNGWTDARFNTWRDANVFTALPFTGSAKPVVDKDNNKISLIDNEFHIYTIDWREEQVDFYIDNVLQDSFTTNVAKGWTEVIIGYRNLPWAGDYNWTGTHTLVVDYLKIEPLQALSTNDFNTKTTEVNVFPNPIAEEINIKASNPDQIKKMELFNTISASILKLNKFQNKIDVSNLSKGIYFLKIDFSDGTSTSKKIIKK